MTEKSINHEPLLELMMERGKSMGRINSDILQNGHLDCSLEFSPSIQQRIQQFLPSTIRTDYLIRAYSILMNKHSSWIQQNIGIKRFQQRMKKIESMIASFIIQDNENETNITTYQRLYWFKWYVILHAILEKPSILQTYKSKWMDVVRHPPYIICPEQWNTFLHNKKLKEGELIHGTSGQVPVTRLYTCSRCKQNKTTCTELQTRSADEGMTLMIRCLTCGKRWNIYN